MKVKLLLTVFLLFSILTFAKRVPVEQAMKIGKNYFYERINQSKSLAYNEVSLVFFSADIANDPAYYIFNQENNTGFIIVSAEDAASPILGYSFEKTFNAENIAPPLATFLSGYARQIKALRINNISSTTDVQKQWDELDYTNPSKSVKSIMTVDPLLLAEWNQDFPYNAQCPTLASHLPTAQTSGGSGGYVYVGCVAVAMAQVMKYHNYPLHGTGSYTHTSAANGEYGNKAVNFASQTYNWYQMPFTTNGSIYPDELSKLMYHLGVALKMHWGPDGSGSQTSMIVTALKNYFQYNTTCSIISKNIGYTDATWKAALIQQLDLNRPVCYSGYPPDGSAGHAWNCDGYQGTSGSELFHMNWGWGGYNNGFYLLTDLYSTASPTDSISQSLMNGQQMVINIFPKTTVSGNPYPEYCTSSKTFIADEGNFEDGSGNQNYQNNQNCTYLIQPTCGKYINLQFKTFDVDPGDIVYIYDGPNTSSPLLATIYGGETTGSYVSEGGQMLINFVTNGSTVKTGWIANYKVDYCKTGILTNLPNGSLDDGSGTCNYRQSSNCNWTIDVPTASSIIINFTAFNMAADADYVSIYKNDLSAANLIRKCTNAIPPTGTITVNASKAMVRFFTTASIAAQGWTLDYSSVLTGVNKIDNLVSDIYVYPNPFTDDTQINFDLASNSNLSLSITNVLGQVLYSYDKYSVAGSFSYSLKTLIPTVAEGVYFINLKTDKNNIVKKIICTK